MNKYKSLFLSICAVLVLGLSANAQSDEQKILLRNEIEKDLVGVARTF